jgi:hypothetical protein
MGEIDHSAGTEIAVLQELAAGENICHMGYEPVESRSQMKQFESSAVSKITFRN